MCSQLKSKTRGKLYASLAKKWYSTCQSCIFAKYNEYVFTRKIQKIVLSAGSTYKSTSLIQIISWSISWASLLYVINQKSTQGITFWLGLGIRIRKFVFNIFAYQIFQESSIFLKIKKCTLPFKDCTFQKSFLFVGLLIDFRTLSCLKDSHSTSYMSELWGDLLIPTKNLNYILAPSHFPYSPHFL